MKLSWIRYGVLVGLAGVLCACATAGAATLRWSRPVRIDRVSLDGLACPSVSLCVAVDSAGRLAVSTRPTGGARRWRLTGPRPAVHDALDGISCPSVRLCVAIDTTGDVIASRNPARLRSWSAAHVDSSTNPNGAPLLTGISCPSTAFCVAVDAVGNAITSTRPTGGPSAWTLRRVDSGINYECYHYNLTGPSCTPGIIAVSCASTTRCNAIDWAGGILSSTNPAGQSSWGGGELPGSESYDGLACPTAGFCLLSQLYTGQLFLWHRGTVRPSVDLSENGPISGLWCSSGGACFATFTSGQPATTDAFESTKAGSARPRWRPVFNAPGTIAAISCPTRPVCIAADDNGTVLAATPAMPSASSASAR